MFLTIDKTGSKQLGAGAVPKSVWLPDSRVRPGPIPTFPKASNGIESAEQTLKARIVNKCDYGAGVL